MCGGKSVRGKGPPFGEGPIHVPGGGEQAGVGLFPFLREVLIRMRSYEQKIKDMVSTGGAPGMAFLWGGLFSTRLSSKR